MKRSTLAINRKMELLNDVDYEIRPIQTKCEMEDIAPWLNHAFGYPDGISYSKNHVADRVGKSKSCQTG